MIGFRSEGIEKVVDLSVFRGHLTYFVDRHVIVCVNLLLTNKIGGRIIVPDSAPNCQEKMRMMMNDDQQINMTSPSDQSQNRITTSCPATNARNTITATTMA
eukprot:scaffold28929_cov71-Cyclotella_meneghiniana.AAC.6